MAIRDEKGATQFVIHTHLHVLVYIQYLNLISSKFTRIHFEVLELKYKISEICSFPG